MLLCRDGFRNGACEFLTVFGEYLLRCATTIGTGFRKYVARRKTQWLTRGRVAAYMLPEWLGMRGSSYARRFQGPAGLCNSADGSLSSWNG